MKYFYIITNLILIFVVTSFLAYGIAHGGGTVVLLIIFAIICASSLIYYLINKFITNNNYKNLVFFALSFSIISIAVLYPAYSKYKIKNDIQKYVSGLEIRNMQEGPFIYNGHSLGILLRYDLVIPEVGEQIKKYNEYSDSASIYSDSSHNPHYINIDGELADVARGFRLFDYPGKTVNVSQVLLSDNFDVIYNDSKISGYCVKSVDSYYSKPSDFEDPSKSKLSAYIRLLLGLRRGEVSGNISINGTNDYMIKTRISNEEIKKSSALLPVCSI